MNSQKDKIKGKFNSSVGKVKQVAGKALNDKGLESRGLVQKDKGNSQQMRGAIKEKIQKSSYTLGDTIEKVGRKLQRKGHGKIGSKIEKVGNKLEHMAD